MLPLRKQLGVRQGWKRDETWISAFQVSTISAPQPIAVRPCGYTLLAVAPPRPRHSPPVQLRHTAVNHGRLSSNLHCTVLLQRSVSWQSTP
ncbi:hypothetical protein C8Q74DRAFT_707807 [Fomes fomentarius]|nr:hypothetical protein C8Q74DRAFT_707807 [Fomes fomentarius]